MFVEKILGGWKKSDSFLKRVHPSPIMGQLRGMRHTHYYSIRLSLKRYVKVAFEILNKPMQFRDDKAEFCNI